MSGTLQVGNIIGPTTGTDANKVMMGSNQIFVPKVPAFRIVRSGNQALTDDSWNQIDFDSVDLDNMNNFNTSTSRYTPTVEGWYTFNIILYLSVNTNLNRWIGSIGKNSAGYGSGRVWDTDLYDNTQNAYQTMNGSRMYYMNGSTDFVEAWCFIDATSGTPVISSGQSTFEGHLVTGV